MQVDEATLARYRKDAPELLNDIDTDGDDAPWVMKRDPASGMCVRLEGGWCGLHKKYGDAFLGDACHFYPRVTRALGDKTTMTATASCPEIVRLMLEEDSMFGFDDASVERLPHGVKNYLPEVLSADDALAVHRAFLAAAEDRTVTAEQSFLRMASVSRSLELIDKKSWPQAVSFYLRNADGRLPQAEVHSADPFNILHALSGLIVASQKPMSPRLKQTVDDMEKALSVTLDWQNVLIHVTEGSAGAYENIRAQWQGGAAKHYEEPLRRWLQLQLSLALFPFSGLGGNLTERITIIGVRLATVRLALMCSCGIHGAKLPQDVVVRIMQSLSRFLDHLGNPAFSLQIYAETGWNRESRMRALLEN